MPTKHVLFCWVAGRMDCTRTSFVLALVFRFNQAIDLKKSIEEAQKSIILVSSRHKRQ